MHDLNISGLATYVNCPEITRQYDHSTRSFPRWGFAPDRHVHGRRAVVRPDAPIPERSEERCRGRLSRDPGARSVPLARGSRLPGEPRLDRGTEPADRGL